MITIDELGKAYSLIEIPPFDGLAKPEIKYEHELERLNERKLLVNLKVTIEIHEVMGSRIFKIFFCTYKYRINITKSLVANDLYSVWSKSAKDLIKAFNKFERSKGWTETQINVGDPDLNLEVYEGLVSWFYTPQN
jgi:hypothetical protein